MALHFLIVRLWFKLKYSKNNGNRSDPKDLHVLRLGAVNSGPVIKALDYSRNIELIVKKLISQLDPGTN